MTMCGAGGVRRGERCTWRGLAAALALALAASGALGQELNERVRSLLAADKLGPARVGVSIIDGQDGTVLAAIDAAGAYAPASNMKVLTTGTALKVLGCDFAFRTELVLQGKKLVVRGSGDPGLADPELLEQMEPRKTVDDVLGALATAAAAAVTGGIDEIVVDDRIFDRQVIHPEWPADQLSERYCAQVSGLNFHANVLSVFAQPAIEGVGRAPRLLTDPEAPWVEFENKARTIAQKKCQISLMRRPDGNRFVVTGEVGMASQGPVLVTLGDNPLFMGRLLAGALRKAGVTVRGAAGGEAVRLPADGERLDGGTVVAAVSTPMATVLERCNTDSYNLYADCLIKRFGHEVTGEPGSWANGGSVMRMTMAEVLGPSDAAGTVISDGSGLSRDNRVSPGTMTRWLVAIGKDKKIGPCFIESLAVPGRGTLKKRFREGPSGALKNELHAKSGYINHVRALSGYLINPGSGRRVAFSILVNKREDGAAFDDAAAKKFQDDVVVALDRWLTARAPMKEPVLGG
jgi:D-alanyl-D-alanine carboxypeptidase/D-alanyl-D-alanine-endopeptidase (penicillin-binding protein 4)